MVLAQENVVVFMETLGLAWILCALLQLLLWCIQERSKEADIVDFGWTLSLGLLAVGYAALLPGAIESRVLVAIVAGAWSLRLGGYLLRYRVLVRGEDERYAALRKSWGNKSWWKFLLFFQAQGLLSVILSLPFFVIASSPAAPSLAAQVLGIAVAAMAIMGEHIADAQLLRFKSHPQNRGRTCRQGLWRFSRHPNYFFEWMYWWSYVVIGIALPWGAVTLIGPFMMYYFLRYLTGIPSTEARAVESRGDDYRHYQETTNAFFPWYPRKRGGTLNA